MWPFRKKVKTKTVRELKDVKAGEMIGFNYYQSKATVNYIKVVYNNPDDEKIHFKITFADGTNLFEVREYSHYYFRNFSTLNPIGVRYTDSSDKEGNNVKSPNEQLEKMISDCEKSEDYESAQILKEAITKLERITLKKITQ